MQSPQPKAVLLIRVSDPRQEKEGLSLDNQEQTLRAYAQERRYHVEREFRFQETADLKIRRNFQEMVRFVRSKKDVVAIIGYRVDRLTRNYHDHVLLDELRMNQGKELHFVHDRLVVDRNTVGRDIAEWDTKVYLAKSYLNRLKEDARITIKYKLSKGEWPCKAPFGYRNLRRDGRGWVEPTADAPIAERILRLYASGAHSMDQVRMAIKSEFGVALSNGKVDHILANPFYSGWMRFQGNLYRHQYRPLVPYSVYKQILSVKQGHKKVSYKFAGLEFPYRGLVTCGKCGCRVTCERKRKGGRTYHYYHCTQYFGKHKAAYLSEADLDAQFDSLLRSLRIPDKWAEAIEARLSTSTTETAEVIATKRKSLLTERQRLHTRLETLYDDRLDGLLAMDSYKARRERTEQSMAELDRQLEDLARAQTEGDEASISLVRLCSGAREAFRVAKAAQKRAILKLVLSNCTLNEKRLVWELKKPFDTVFLCAARQTWQPLADAFRNGSLEFAVAKEEIDAVLNLTCPTASQAGSTDSTIDSLVA